MNKLRTTRTNLKPWGGALTGAGQGSQMGTQIGGTFGGAFGKATGAVVGTIAGAIFGHKREKKQAKEEAELQARIDAEAAKAKLTSDRLAAEAEYDNDQSYLNQFKLMNTNSLYKCGGKIKRCGGKLKATGGRIDDPPKRAILKESDVKGKVDENKASFSGKSTGGDTPYNEYDEVSLLNELTDIDDERIGVHTSNLKAAGKLKERNDFINKVNKQFINNDKFLLDPNYNEGLTIIRPTDAKYNSLKSTYTETPTVTSVGKKPTISGLEVVGFTQGKGKNKSNALLRSKSTGEVVERPITEIQSNQAYKDMVGSSYKYGIAPTDTLSTRFNRLRMSSGGKLPAKNSIKLDEGVYLATNDNGGTSGTHETGDNIPVRTNGKVVAYVEPGEVLNDDVVLSKRLGYAGKYLALEKAKIGGNKAKIERMQNQITDENEMIAPVADNANEPKKAFWGAIIGLASKAQDKIDKDISNMGSMATNIGSYIMANKQIKNQKKLIEKSMKEVEKYNPRLNKFYAPNTKVDVSDQIGAIDDSYNSYIDSIDSQVSDPSVASALKAKAYLDKGRMKGSVYGERGRVETELENNRIAGINENNAVNNSILNLSNENKLNARLQGYAQLGNLEGLKTENMMDFARAMSGQLAENRALKSIESRYSTPVVNDMYGSNNGGGLLSNLLSSKGSNSTGNTGGFDLNFLKSLGSNVLSKSNGGKLKRVKSSRC